jgi:transglutaminase-like putative cysteine protease
MNFKAFLALWALLAAQAISPAAAVDLGTPASVSPYEPYMRSVKQVLSALASSGTSMDRVKELMREGRSFRYSFTEPYVAQLPETTARTRTGDCKAKSLWIANEMGDRDHVRYVIGKARRTSKISHAWILWNDGGQWWILDPTNTSRPIAADSVSKNEYIPLYSYDSRHCYRHSAAQIFTASAAAAGSPVAGELQK